MAQSSQERYTKIPTEMLINTLADGIILITSDETIQLVNTPACRLLHLESRDIVSKDYHYLTKRMLTNADRLQNGIHAALTHEQSAVIDSLLINSDDDTTCVLSCAITPITTDTGTACVLTLHDVTTYVELQNLKDEFISVASHELRTPMTVIAGYADLLLNPMFGEITDKQRHYIERTKQTTKDLISLVNDMLDITKLESGKLENIPQQIDIKEFIDLIVSDLHDDCAAKNVQVTTAVTPKDIYVDRNRLRLLLTNLISNAIKFSSDNGSVEISSIIGPGGMEVSIVDHGPGVPLELQQEIFTKFSRTKNTISADKSGTGLGLAIAREIVGNWGGTLNVQSDGTHGSRFYFTVPATIFTPPEEVAR